MIVRLVVGAMSHRQPVVKVAHLFTPFEFAVLLYSSASAKITKYQDDDDDATTATTPDGRAYVTDGGDNGSGKSTSLSGQGLRGDEGPWVSFERGKDPMDAEGLFRHRPTVQR